MHFHMRQIVHRCVVFPCNVSYDTIEMYQVIAGIPEWRWYFFRLEKLCDQLINCKDHYRFWCSPESMSKLLGGVMYG